ncbi:hypothetical protein HMPREF1871_01010 [Gemelliphila asaccharolytica]|uniref:Uncharacterized protein n=1 Tax=Gemelliphila asaccharolytica TaxID=502393 RepID=A0ABR5TL54_9BACL|nr:hypothetical protein HMPREF1871_01010 [Gemella asaccharolytica]
MDDSNTSVNIFRKIKKKKYLNYFKIFFLIFSKKISVYIHISNNYVKIR